MMLTDLPPPQMMLTDLPPPQMMLTDLPPPQMMLTDLPPPQMKLTPGRSLPLAFPCWSVLGSAGVPYEAAVGRGLAWRTGPQPDVIGGAQYLPSCSP